MVKGIYLEVPSVKLQCLLKRVQLHLTLHLLQSPVIKKSQTCQSPCVTAILYTFVAISMQNLAA